MVVPAIFCGTLAMWAAYQPRRWLLGIAAGLLMILLMVFRAH